MTTGGQKYDYGTSIDGFDFHDASRLVIRAGGRARNRVVEVGEHSKVVSWVRLRAIGVVQLPGRVRGGVRIAGAAVERSQKHAHGDSQLDIDDVVDRPAAVGEPGSVATQY